MEASGPDLAEVAPDDGGDASPSMQVHAGSHEVCMAEVSGVQQQLDLSQLPVEALLSALNRKPEAELREASGCLTALGAKLQNVLCPFCSMCPL